MISGRQIRAGRALLDWKVEDLSSHSGVNRESILHAERGEKRTRQDTLQKIERAMKSAGIDFTENNGVRQRPEGIEVYEGEDRFNEFYDFLYEHVRKNGGEICLSISDERLLSKYRKDPVMHYERMQDLFDKGIFKSFRILASKSNFATKYSYNQYKWKSGTDIAPTAFYTFGDCLALISFAHSPAPYVAVLQSAPIAQSYRQAFEAEWAAAKEPPASKGAT